MLNEMDKNMLKLLENKSFKGLNNNQLKIIAMISMVIDHVGLMFFPKYDIQIPWPSCLANLCIYDSRRVQIYQESQEISWLNCGNGSCVPVSIFGVYEKYLPRNSC